VPWVALCASRGTKISIFWWPWHSESMA